MKTRLLSALLVFLLVASVSIPAVSAGPSPAYYELHEMTHTHQSNHIGPAACVILVGMGYEYEGNDIWFIDYDYKNKRINAYPHLDDHTLVKLRRYIESVDECRAKYDEVGGHVFLTVVGAAATAGGVVFTSLTDDSIQRLIPVLVSAGYTVAEAKAAIDCVSASIKAKDEAVRLFNEL